MKVSFFDTHSFEKHMFSQGFAGEDIELEFFEVSLNASTAPLAKGSQAVCCFVNDRLDEACLKQLKGVGVNFVALRCAGFNNVDLKAADRLGIEVVRVPAYSPSSVAEYAVGLLLTLNRKIHRAYNRVRELNFALDGLVGFDLRGKTVGVVGCGKIGKIFAEIMVAFGCRILIYDAAEDSALKAHDKVEYVDLATLCEQSDVISLHIPLTPDTHHLIDAAMIDKMKTGVFLVNTGRGALIDTKALVQGLKNQKIGAAALDVYEEEENVFFHDLSGHILEDDTLARLLTFPNVLISSHQAFLTKEALGEIVSTTRVNLESFAKGENPPSENQVGLHLFKS